MRITLLILGVLLATGCRKTGIDTGLSSVPTTPITATLMGTVLDENDLPAAGVTIKVGNRTMQSDAFGSFRIVQASLDKKQSLVTAEKFGYFKAYRTFMATAGANNVEIKLIRRTLAGSVNGAAGGEAALVNGSKIALPANGVMDAVSGAPYTGTVSVYAAYIDPMSPDIHQTIPGSLMADDNGGKRVTLASYGMMAVELEGASGQKLQVKTGSTATLTTVIPASLQASAPASIPLWFVNDANGVWKEEGIALKTGNTYVGTVSHFSFWNVDLPKDAVQLNLTILGPSGSPLSGIKIQLKRADGQSTSGVTDSLGQVSGLVPKNETLGLEALGPCGNVMYNAAIGPFANNTALAPITLSGGIQAVLVTGKILSCANAPQPNTEVWVYFPNHVVVTNTDANGIYGCTIPVCPGSVVSVVVKDPATGEFGGIYSTQFVTGSLNIPVLSLCAAQNIFVRYTAETRPYLISGSGALFVVTAQPVASNPALTHVSIGGTMPNNLGTLHFEFEGSGLNIQLGHLIDIKSGPSGSTTLLQASNTFMSLTLTQWAAVAGDYFEGSFTGQYREMDGSTRNMTCQFRVRRP
jgi:hypothetical protein